MDGHIKPHQLFKTFIFIAHHVRKVSRPIEQTIRLYVFAISVFAPVDVCRNAGKTCNQIHGIDPRTPIEETLEALNDLVRSGKVLYIGVSNLAAWQIEKALGVSERRGWARFVSVQAYYSLVARDLEVEVLPMAREEGLGVMTWSPLAGGYVSGKYRAGRPEVARRNAFDFPQVSAHAEDALAVLEEVAGDRGVSMARVALAWLRQQPGVTSVILGARGPEQLDDNLKAADLELTPDELERLAAPTAPVLPYPQWMIELQSRPFRPPPPMG